MTFYSVFRVITLQNTIMRVKAELDQMREGLKLHGCLAMMEEYPSLMEKLFVPGEDYNARGFWIMCLTVYHLCKLFLYPCLDPFLSLFRLCLFLSKMREFCHNRQAFQFIDVQVFG